MKVARRVERAGRSAPAVPFLQRRPSDDHGGHRFPLPEPRCGRDLELLASRVLRGARADHFAGNAATAVRTKGQAPRRCGSDLLQPSSSPALRPVSELRGRRFRNRVELEVVQRLLDRRMPDVVEVRCAAACPAKRRQRVLLLRLARLILAHCLTLYVLGSARALLTAERTKRGPCSGCQSRRAADQRALAVEARVSRRPVLVREPDR